MTPLTEEQRALAADPRWVRFAVNTARAFARRTGPRHLADEFESAALVALCRAAAGGFDPARGTQFKHYLAAAVVHECLNVADSWQPRPYRRRNRAGRPARRELHPGLPSPEEPVGWALEYEDEVEGLVATLPPREAEALRRRHLRPDTRVEDIGRLLGVSTAEASRTLSRAYRDAKGRAA